MPTPTPTPTPTSYEALVDKYYAEAMQAQGMSPTPTPTPSFVGPQAPQQESLGSSAAALGAKIGMKIAQQKAATQAAQQIAAQQATNAGTQALFNQGAGEASQLAWNSGANAASGAAANSAATTAAPTILGNASAMGAGPISAIIAGTALGGKAAYDMLQGKKPNLAGRVTLGVATGGLSELANYFLNHKSTKDFQRERWGKIANSADAPTAAYGKQYLDYLGSDQAKTDALYPNTFDAKKAAGTLGAKDVWGSKGMFDTFGGDWLGKYSEDQRSKISQSLIDNNVLTSDHGDTLVSDAAKAKTLADAILAAPAASTRSTTRSPGIGKDGKPVYSARR